MIRFPVVAKLFSSRRASLLALAIALAPLLIAGCGGTTTQNKDFFTSGSKEADQRADQRMAQDEQLKGKGSGGPSLGDNQRSLYDRLGGKAGLDAISDDFITRAMADPRVNFTRQGITQGGFSIHRDRSMEWDASAENVRLLKGHMSQFLAVATGGPSAYEGKEMKAAHADMHITNAEFDAALGDLKATLDKFKIDNKEQKELLAIMETTRPQIVEEQ
jgi:hemoglobin